MRKKLDRFAVPCFKIAQIRRIQTQPVGPIGYFGQGRTLLDPENIIIADRLSIQALYLQIIGCEHDLQILVIKMHRWHHKQQNDGNDDSPIDRFTSGRDHLPSRRQKGEVQRRDKSRNAQKEHIQQHAFQRDRHDTTHQDHKDGSRHDAIKPSQPLSVLLDLFGCIPPPESGDDVWTPHRPERHAIQ